VLNDAIFINRPTVLCLLRDNRSFFGKFGKYKNYRGTRGSAVVKEPCYKPKVAGSRPDKLNDIFFLIFLILPAALGPEVHSATNRNEYQKQNNNVSEE
jgi:hypothetical protein